MGGRCSTVACLVEGEKTCMTPDPSAPTDYQFIRTLSTKYQGVSLTDKPTLGGTWQAGGFDCGAALDPILTTYKPDDEISSSSYWQNWQQTKCGQLDYDIADTPLVCMDNQFWQGLDPVTKIGTMNATWSMVASAQRVYNNWKDAVAADVSDEEFQEDFNLLWPMLYQQVKILDDVTNTMVDNPMGKNAIDNFLIMYPKYNTEAIKSILYNNYTNENQAYYGFMNATNDCNDYWRWLENPPYVETGPPNDYPPVYYPCSQDPNLDNPINYPKTTFYDTLHRMNWQTERGFHLIEDPNTGVYRNPGMIGNPYWDKKTRQQAAMMAYGILPYNPADPGEQGHGGEANPFARVPGYSGELPKLGKAFNQGNPPVNTPVHHNAGDPTYEDPCDEVGPIQELLPWVTGLAGALVPFVILPKEALSPYVLSATLAYSGYYIAIDSYGPNAFQRKIAGIEYYSDKAASALSIGIPAGLWLAGWDIGIFQRFDIPIETKWVLLPPIALSFDWYFQQNIVDSLGQATGILAIITYPISLLEQLLTYFFSGCVKQIFDSPFGCKCDTAQKVEGGKTDIRNTLLEYYGVTQDQYKMRGKCMELEMSRGLWKSLDPTLPDVIGECDVHNGEMVNETACWSAGRWTFGPPDYPDMNARPDPGDQMWGYYGEGKDNSGGIWHCLDAENPSFLPPDATTNKDLAAKNKQCESKYGEGFRWIDKNSDLYYDPAFPNGICKNLALPGPNPEDGPGLQEPGQFK